MVLPVPGASESMATQRGTQIFFFQVSSKSKYYHVTLLKILTAKSKHRSFKFLHHIRLFF